MAKRTSTANLQAQVPNFAARWHLFCNYFLTPEIDNKNETNQSNMGNRNHPFTAQKKKIPTPRKIQSQVIKTPNHLKIEQNTNTLSLKLCMPHQALLT
jgi:hypothetical protein